MKTEKISLLMNKVVELNRPDDIYCKGFLYKDSEGHYISVVEDSGEISYKDKIYLKDGDDDHITKAEKPKLMRVSYKSWHYRLVKKVLKDKVPTQQTMQNGCPYYWLLVFSMIVYPFILLGKALWFVFLLIPNIMMWVLERTVGAWMDGIVENQVYGYSQNYRGWSNDVKMPITARLYFKRSKKLNNSKDSFMDYFLNEKYGLDFEHNKTKYLEKKKELLIKWDEWKKEFNERRAKSEEKLEKRNAEFRKKRNARLLREDLRRERWNERLSPITDGLSKFMDSIVAKDWKTIIRRTKQFVGAVITIGLLLLSFLAVNIIAVGLIALVDLTINNWEYPAGVGILGVIGGILYVLYLFITGWVQTIVNKYKGGKRVWYIEPFIYALYYPLKYVVLGIAYGSYYTFIIPLKFVFYTIIWTVLVKIGKFVWSLLLSFGKGVGGSTGIFGEYFSASYTAYCPGIEWVDTEEDEEE